MSTKNAWCAPVMPVRVRPFAPADRDAVLQLTPRLTVGMAPWLDPDAFLAAARGWIEGSIAGIGPDRAVLVAEDAWGRCVGFVSVGRNRHFTGEEQAYVGELAVAKEMEGRGVGRALLAKAEAWARERGYRLIALETGAANVRARASTGGLATPRRASSSSRCSRHTARCSDTRPNVPRSPPLALRAGLLTREHRT
jgi:GNAT superfamily N-acetyltransferase